MDKIEAAKVEGLLTGARMHLEALADHLRQLAPTENRHARFARLAHALNQLRAISDEIYEAHPDISPHRKEGTDTTEEREGKAHLKSGE